MPLNELETRTQSATVRVTYRDLGTPEISDLLMTLEWTGRLLVFAAVEHPDKQAGLARSTQPMHFHQFVNKVQVQVHSPRMASPLEVAPMISAIMAVAGGTGTLLAHRIMGVVLGWQRVRIARKDAELHAAIVKYLTRQMEVKSLVGSGDVERMAQVLPLIDQIEVEEP